MDDATFTLSGVELFADLSDADIAALNGRCRWRRYAPDEHIIGDHDDTTDVFFIVSGQVRATVFAASGKEVSFRDLGPGKSIGELSAVDGAPRSANVIALTDAVLASMPAETFRTVLRDYGNMSAATVLFVLERALAAGDRGRLMLGALGPGFTAAFLLLETV